jgi:acyl phosphate:glycerol-3-phosphate acyltransferase
VTYFWLAGAAVLAYLIGAIPVSNIIARMVKGIDLREVDSGTVSPSNLYRAVGLRPALIAGVFEVAKGAPGPALIGVGRHPWIAALAGALAVCGHNWSPFLKGAGGRGLSTATGVLLVVAWPAAAVMVGGLLVGGLTKRVYPAMSVALFALLPVAAAAGGIKELGDATLVVIPVGLKTGLVLRQRRSAKKKAANETVASDTMDKTAPSDADQEMAPGDAAHETEASDTKQSSELDPSPRVCSSSMAQQRWSPHETTRVAEPSRAEIFLVFPVGIHQQLVGIRAVSAPPARAHGAARGNRADGLPKLLLILCCQHA